MDMAVCRHTGKHTKILNTHVCVVKMKIYAIVLFNTICTHANRIVQPYQHVFGLGQTADDNTETLLYQGNYNSLLQSWLGKDY